MGRNVLVHIGDEQGIHYYDEYWDGTYGDYVSDFQSREDAYKRALVDGSVYLSAFVFASTAGSGDLGKEDYQTWPVLPNKVLPFWILGDGRAPEVELYGYGGGVDRDKKIEDVNTILSLIEEEDWDSLVMQLFPIGIYCSPLIYVSQSYEWLEEDSTLGGLLRPSEDLSLGGEAGFYSDLIRLFDKSTFIWTGNPSDVVLYLKVVEPNVVDNLSKDGQDDFYRFTYSLDQRVPGSGIKKISYSFDGGLVGMKSC